MAVGDVASKIPSAECAQLCNSCTRSSWGRVGRKVKRVAAEAGLVRLCCGLL